MPCDVLETESLENLVSSTLDAFGRIDVLVNNAGGTGPRAALETSERYFEMALRFNVTQAFLLSKLVVPKMLETAGGGSIVNISSRASDMVQTAFAAYGAGKAALNQMTRNVAAETLPLSVRRHMGQSFLKASYIYIASPTLAKRRNKYFL